MNLPFVDAEELDRRLPMGAAIDALETAFRDGDPEAAALRSHVETPAGALLLMPASSEAGVGVKLATVTETNPPKGLPLIHAVYVLFDRTTQAPTLLIDGSALTAVRTAAVSALATRWLAREGDERLVIFGAGVQARAHLDAMTAVRPISELVVVTRTPERAGDLLGTARARGIHASLGDPSAVERAEIVCTCTTATRPLFGGASLRPGTHVNAVGAYRPDTRELDAAAVRRARVVVETRAAAWAEAGDLVIASEEGAITQDHVVADMREVVNGAEVRRSADEITLFKSVGLAFEDLAVASAAARAIDPRPR